jgi:hypothetical protein
VRGYTNHAIFEHNTIAYTVVNPFLMDRGFKVHIKNNLFYSAHSFGGNPTHIFDGWLGNYPDSASSSIIQIRARDTVSYWRNLYNTPIINGPEDLFVNPDLGVTAAMLTPDKRVLHVNNNAYFWPQKLKDFVIAYNDTTTIWDSISIPNFQGGYTDLVKRTIKMPKFISNYAKWVLDSLFVWNNTENSFSGNVEADPGFSNSNVVNHIDRLNHYIKNISLGVFDSAWFFNPNNSLYPPAWPLPENLNYTNAALIHAGTDGFAVGDLNWFPEQKEQWLTSVEVNPSDVLPSSYTLSDAYPNPFNPETKIDFSVKNMGKIKIHIYNVLGQKVRTLVNKEFNAGNYTATWNGKDDFGKQVASGTYIYSLEAGDVRLAKKMVLLK